jgi:hypothetical protein
MKTTLISLSGLCLLLAACGAQNTGSNVTPPGADKTAKTSTLETGAALLQNKEPLSALNVYMDGFHFYNGNMKGQMEAHHYCAVLNEDLISASSLTATARTQRSWALSTS